MPTASPAATTPPALAGLRGDLVVSVVKRAGARIAVIKDPVAHTFFEMPEDDFRAAGLIDPSLALPQQLAALRRDGPQAWRSADDETLARRLYRVSAEMRACGLARVGAATVPPRSSNDFMADARRILQRVVAVLFYRVPLGDPSPLLECLQPWCGFLFRPAFLVLAALFTVISAVVFVWSGGPASFEAGWFASWQALLAFYAGLVLLKVLHEAAHAVAVRHYGGRVHETGMTLIAGLPLFYVEASDSYLFPKKSQRIAVAAAGIVAELFLAALMVWLWLFMADGFARQLVLNLLLVASVSTILFNGNPLMRFDGYYILAEAIGMPNLRERSMEFLTSRVRRILLGAPVVETPRRTAWLLGSYGVLSQAYLIVVVLGIWRFLSLIAQPSGLQWAVNLLVGAWVLHSLALPFAGFCASLFREASSVHGKRRKRALLGLGAAAILAGIFIFVPFPHWVSRSCVLQPAGDSVVRAAVDGFVVEVYAAEGDIVSSGQPIALLRNNSLQTSLQAAQLELSRAETQLRGAVTSGSLAQVCEAKSAVASAEARRAELQKQSGQLVLAAPVAGVVATRDMAQLQGTLLKAGDVLCVVQPGDLDEFLVPLGEKEARQVRAGASVRLRLRSQPWKLFAGEIVANPMRLNAEELPTGLRQMAGGDVAVSSDAANKQTLLSDTHFAKVRISDPDPSLKIGMTGRVRIECGRQSLAARLAGAIADFVRLDVRMQ